MRSTFYKGYHFKKNVKKTLHYILDGQKNFRQGILTNNNNLLSFLEITSSNFKEIRSDFNDLKSDTNMKFDNYFLKLMHTITDTVFYDNYVNILHRIDHDLVIHNNQVERIKSIIYMKCRNFLSVLHILARNRIPESILHSDVLSNILYGSSQDLLKDNTYSLLYGSVVNPYYNMEIVNSFISNNVLYMTITLQLKQSKHL